MKNCLAIFVVLLSGCAAAPLVYNPSNSDERDMARVVANNGHNSFSRAYNAQIEYIWNYKGEELTKRNFLMPALSEVRLIPGVYKFKVLCKKGGLEASPEAEFLLSLGKAYIIDCEVERGEIMFGIRVDAAARLTIRELQYTLD